MAISWDEIEKALGITGGRTPPLNTLIEEFGGGARGRSRLSQDISGTRDKKSKEYKTAMRNLQRYSAASGKQQRKPKQVQTKLRTAWTKERTRIAINELRGKSVRITIQAPRLRVSKDERTRMGTISEAIAPQVWDKFADLANRGDYDEATLVLMDGVLYAYGGISGEVISVGNLTIGGG